MKTTFANYLNELNEIRSIIIPDSEVNDFCDYANTKGIYPHGGAILDNGLRVLYL